MPEPADEEDHQDIQQPSAVRHAVASEGNIQVVAKPRRQRDMPTPPELGNAPGEIGVGKIPHELDPEQSRGSDRDVRVAGEVAIDLNRKADRRVQELPPRCRTNMVVGLGNDLRQTVGDHNLDEESPQDLAKRVGRCFEVEHAAPGKLTEQIPRPHDRSGNEVRKEENEAKVAHRIVDGIEFPAIHVDRVAERLKRVKADSHGKDDAERHGRRMQAEERAEAGKRIAEEIEVFEKRQGTEVGDERQEQPCPSFPFVLLLFENETHAEIDPGRAQKKHRESPVPRAVKHQAREHDQPVLADLAEGPIQCEHDDVEDNERERREDHARRPNDSRFSYTP